MHDTDGFEAMRLSSFCNNRCRVTVFDVFAPDLSSVRISDLRVQLAVVHSAFEGLSVTRKTASSVFAGFGLSMLALELVAILMEGSESVCLICLLL